MAGRDLGPDRFTAANINPILDINHFAYPAAFTPGNAGRNITTGTRLLWSQVSASKGFRITEKLSAKFRWDFQNCLKTYNFNTAYDNSRFQESADICQAVRGSANSITWWPAVDEHYVCVDVLTLCSADRHFRRSAAAPQTRSNAVRSPMQVLSPASRRAFFRRIPYLYRRT